MKWFALVVFLSWHGSFGSGRLLALEKAQQSWQRFLDCRKFKAQENDFLRCTENEIASEATPPVRSKLRQFLDQEIPFSQLHKCTEVDLIQPLQIIKAEEIFCLNLEGLKNESYGYVRFSREKLRYKIKEVRFKY